jgi:hypothetical protein
MGLLFMGFRFPGYNDFFLYLPRYAKKYVLRERMLMQRNIVGAGAKLIFALSETALIQIRQQ